MYIIELTPEEVTLMADALDMALASNKRMQNSKPKFISIFRTIENDINQLKAKLLATKPSNKK